MNVFYKTYLNDGGYLCLQNELLQTFSFFAIFKFKINEFSLIGRKIL